MKASMIQRSLAVVVFSVIALAAGAQEHQTYNGPFGHNRRQAHVRRQVHLQEN